MIAYLSINHLGYCILALFAIAASPVVADRIDTHAALSGVFMQIFNHGITAATLFYFVGLLEQRRCLRGIDDFGGYMEFFRKDGPKVFATVQDSAAQKDLAEANAAAAAAMAGLKKWFEGERAHAAGHFALGEPLFLEMLRATERVDIPIAGLLESGRADLERNTQALTAACAHALVNTLG